MAEMVAKGKEPIYVPREIVSDILTRLPIETLTRLTSACKHWSNQISDPLFIKLHSQRVTPNPNFIFRDSRYSDKLVFYDVVKDQKTKLNLYLDNDIEHYSCGERYETLLYSCNGLLLVTGFHDAFKTDRYFVVNPVTKQSVSVPKVTDMDSISSEYTLFSMGFDSVSERYKIVFCGYDKNNGYLSKIITVGKEEEWRNIVFPQQFNLQQILPVFANGAIHWMMDSVDAQNLDFGYTIEPESMGKILTLDVGKEEFITILHPECESGVYTMLESNGLLHFLTHVSNTELGIWVLKDLVKSEWEEILKVDLGHLELPLKGFLNDCYPFTLWKNSNYKMIIRKHYRDDYTFYTYDVESEKLDSELGILSSWIEFASELEHQFFPLKYVSSLASF